MDPALDWDALKRLRDLWPGKLLLKGVERPDDAERAAAMGCDGIVVSNHGGRQLDGAAPTLDALPAVAQRGREARSPCSSTAACAAAWTSSRRAPWARTAC